MKKLLLFAFIAILASCSKDDTEPATIDITGTWKVQAHIIENYNTAGVKVSEENRLTDPDAFSKIVFTQTTAVVTYNKGTTSNSDIVLSAANGKNYLHFKNKSISDIDQIEVSVSGTKLNFYAEGGTPKSIAKIQFNKQ